MRLAKNRSGMRAVALLCLVAVISLNSAELFHFHPAAAERPHACALCQAAHLKALTSSSIVVLPQSSVLQIRELLADSQIERAVPSRAVRPPPAPELFST